MILPIWVWLLISPFMLAYWTVKVVLLILWKLLEALIEQVDKYNANHPLPGPQRPSVSHDGPVVDPPLGPKSAPGPRDWVPEDFRPDHY